MVRSRPLQRIFFIVNSSEWVKGAHVYYPKTRLWAFIKEDGALNTAFKFSEEQFKHLLETGIVK